MPMGRGAAGVRAGYNPSTGYGGYRAGATTPYGSWSRGAVTNGDDWVRAGSVSGPRGSAGGVQGSGGGSLVHAENRFGNGVTVGKSGDGDIYAGKDGNIYQRTENGWEQQTPATPKQTTQGAGKPADRAKPDNTAATRAKPSAEQAGYLQRESAARERGDQTASELHRRHGLVAQAAAGQAADDSTSRGIPFPETEAERPCSNAVAHVGSAVS